MKSYEKDIIKINKKIMKLKNKIINKFIPKIIDFMKLNKLDKELFGSIYIEIIINSYVKIYYPKKILKDCINYKIKKVKTRNYVHKYKDILSEFSIRKMIVNEANNKYNDYTFYESSVNFILVERKK
jgi:hypothetical protein